MYLWGNQKGGPDHTDMLWEAGIVLFSLKHFADQIGDTMSVSCFLICLFIASEANVNVIHCVLSLNLCDPPGFASSLREPRLNNMVRKY